MKSLILILLLIGGIWWFYIHESPVRYGPGVMAPDAPWQERVSGREAFTHGDYKIHPLATFRIEAKVLGKESYYLDREAAVSPVDLTLGWGAMSDESVLESIEIFQSRRAYRWTSRNLPVSEREVERSSANMHMIPADDEVAAVLDDVRVGQIVEIEGFLVRVEGENKWKWNSSLTRDDIGQGACEVVYVKRIQIREIPEADGT